MPLRFIRFFLVPAVFVSCLILYAGFWFVERFPEMAGQLVKLSAVEIVSGPATYVRDGDTIEVGGVAIRFGSLDCPEATTASGYEALERMRQLTRRVHLTCFLNGRSSYDRKIGSCILGNEQDIGQIMISEGLCRRFMY